MEHPNFRDREFWVELRKRTGVNGWVGIEECTLWCDDALRILKEYRGHRFQKIEGSVTGRIIEKYGLSIDTHRVLARKYQEGIFIADGTAGQIDKNYLLGFYGYYREATERLQVFYKPAINDLN